MGLFAEESQVSYSVTLLSLEGSEDRQFDNTNQMASFTQLQRHSLETLLKYR